MDDKFDEILKAVQKTGQADSSNSSSATIITNESYNPTRIVLNTYHDEDEDK